MKEMIFVRAHRQGELYDWPNMPIAGANELEVGTLAFYDFLEAVVASANQQGSPAVDEIRWNVSGSHQGNYMSVQRLAFVAKQYRELVSLPLPQGI